MGQLRRGAKAYKEAKKDAESSKRGETWFFSLKGGEEAVVRFLGTYDGRPIIPEKMIHKMKPKVLENYADIYAAIPIKEETLVDALIRRMRQAEPVIVDSHWINHLNWSHTCGNDPSFKDTSGGCVSCYLLDQGGKYKKTVGWASTKSCFSLFDYRKIHRISKGENDNDYKECTIDEGKCNYCRKESADGPIYPAFHKGTRKWMLGKQRVAALMAYNDQLAKKCIFCEDKINVAGYACSKCNNEFEDLDAEGIKMRCDACGHKGMPVELLVHRKNTKAEHEPVRGTLHDCRTLISRTGSDKDDTVYTFSKDDKFDVGMEPELIEKAGYVDWEKDLAPPSTAEQAAKHKLSSDPFSGGGVGSEDYDDDEDEEDDEDE